MVAALLLLASEARCRVLDGVVRRLGLETIAPTVCDGCGVRVDFARALHVAGYAGVCCGSACAPASSGDAPRRG